jgi:outer membrane protein assembly factor BamD (BamD/ComL family)
VQQYTIELGLLEPARKSIAHGDYAGAMSAIARHQREYPRGQLAEEREALRVRALWGTGQKVSAENAATAFRKRYPRSVLLSWMKEPASPPPKK